MVGTYSLRESYEALALPPLTHRVPPKDTSHAAIAKKISNPPVLEALGAPQWAINAAYHIEWAANSLDTISEGGSRRAFKEADASFTRALALVPQDLAQRLCLITSGAIGYFAFEQYVAKRIARGDRFAFSDVMHFHAARSADSLAYGELARTSGIGGVDRIVAGMVLRQELHDLADSIVDLEEDRATIGANLLLMNGFGGVHGARRLADTFAHEAYALRPPKLLRDIIGREYAAVDRLLS